MLIVFQQLQPSAKAKAVAKSGTVRKTSHCDIDVRDLPTVLGHLAGWMVDLRKWMVNVANLSGDATSKDYDYIASSIAAEDEQMKLRGLLLKLADQSSRCLLSCVVTWPGDIDKDLFLMPSRISCSFDTETKMHLTQTRFNRTWSYKNIFAEKPPLPMLICADSALHTYAKGKTHKVNRARLCKMLRLDEHYSSTNDTTEDITMQPSLSRDGAREGCTSLIDLTEMYDIYAFLINYYVLSGGTTKNTNPQLENASRTQLVESN